MNEVAPLRQAPSPARWRARDGGAFAADEAAASARSATSRHPPLPASDPECLLLASCAAEIASQAGAGAIVHAIAAPRQALLLRDAIAAVGTARDDDRSGELVYLPRAAVALLESDDLLALLRGLAARHPGDTVLVVAVGPPPRLGDAPASTVRSVGCGVPLVEHLARASGWELCQLWTDGAARHALVVCARAVDGTPVRVS